jgi:hypothetical protein
MAENSSSPDSTNSALAKALAAAATALANAGKIVAVRSNLSKEDEALNNSLLAQIRVSQAALGQTELEVGSLKVAPSTEDETVTALRQPASRAQQIPTPLLAENPLTNAETALTAPLTTPWVNPPSTEEVSIIPTGALPFLAEPFRVDVNGIGDRGPVDAGKNAATKSNKKTELVPFPIATDWRVKISLAPGAEYFYNVNPEGSAGILEPLRATKGVIYPYMPKINVTYQANYSSADIAHSNYKVHNYSNSAVENVSITGVFTAQDDIEAAYVLAVIHFFRSATKMFYGQDGNGTSPPRGTPPPLVYLTGLGAYQFDNHPMVIQNFQLDLPDDVDYINAGAQYGGINLANYARPATNPKQTSAAGGYRLAASNLQGGGGAGRPIWTNQMANANSGLGVITRVPTKMTMTISCLPIVTRNAISNKFSLAAYAKGDLLRGSQRSSDGGGIW